MVLRPIDSNEHAEPAAQPTPAWAAVAERQKQRSAGYWLISQPDHANLSGDLAANFVSQQFPRIDALIARAIAVHDAGWALFAPEASPAEPPLLNHDGKPLAFVEFEPEQFLRAWTASIDRAEGICPAGGIIVSRHFCELGQYRLRSPDWIGADDYDRIKAFVDRETARQERLAQNCSYSSQELAGLLAVLQFCDLLSLYLCSGAEREVEFSQQLTDRPVRLRRQEHLYQLDPSPFQANTDLRVVSLGVSARYFPTQVEPKLTTLAFLLC
ncbi:MAG: DUF3891 family protein [Terriglobales bacterium]